MTAAERIRRIRLMEKMAKANSSVEKAEDGTLKYVGKNGNVLIEAKMNQKEEA